MATEDASPGAPADQAAGSPPVRATARFRSLAKDERVAYLATGLFNTAFAFGVFVSLEVAVGDRLHYLVILLITHVVGVLEAFTMYRLFVFKVRGNMGMDLLRFETVNLSALAVNFAMLSLLVELLHVKVILGQMVVMCVVTIGTYLANKHFSFRRVQAAE